MLESLEILNGDMTPKFNPNIYEYDVEVDDSAISLLFDYNVSENASVTIYGNDNLTYGQNHVLLEIYDGQLKTYTFKVYKEKTAEVSSFNNSYEKVEVSMQDQFLNDLITPGISSLCFLTIITLFCVIFKTK